MGQGVDSGSHDCVATLGDSMLCRILENPLILKLEIVFVMVVIVIIETLIFKKVLCHLCKILIIIFYPIIGASQDKVPLTAI